MVEWWSKSFDEGNVSLSFEAFSYLLNQFPEVQIDVDGFASLTNRKADIFFSKSEEAETEEAEDLNHSSLSGGHQADTQEKPTKKKQKRCFLVFLSSIRMAVNIVFLLKYRNEYL